MKSVSLFVTSGRKATASAVAVAAAWQLRAGIRQGSEHRANKTRSTKMGDETKCSSRMLETLKRNTHFTR
jgi:hypothetical protein